MENRREKMDQGVRAKQFMPFDALKGFREALAEKEKIVVTKIELSDEKKEELDRVFNQVKKRDMLRVVYFSKGEYLQIEGMVSKIEVTSHLLTVVNEKIPFESILDMLITKNSQ